MMLITMIVTMNLIMMIVRFAIKDVDAQVLVMMTMYLPAEEFLIGERCHYSPQ